MRSREHARALPPSLPTALTAPRSWPSPSRPLLRRSLSRCLVTPSTTTETVATASIIGTTTYVVTATSLVTVTQGPSPPPPPPVSQAPPPPPPPPPVSSLAPIRRRVLPEEEELFRRALTSALSVVPTYASACDGFAGYSSACAAGASLLPPSLLRRLPPRSPLRRQSSPYRWRYRDRERRGDRHGHELRHCHHHRRRRAPSSLLPPPPPPPWPDLLTAYLAIVGTSLAARMRTSRFLETTSPFARWKACTLAARNPRYAVILLTQRVLPVETMSFYWGSCTSSWLLSQFLVNDFRSLHRTDLILIIPPLLGCNY